MSGYVLHLWRGLLAVVDLLLLCLMLCLLLLLHVQQLFALRGVHLRDEALDVF